MDKCYVLSKKTKQGDERDALCIGVYSEVDLAMKSAKLRANRDLRWNEEGTVLGSIFLSVEHQAGYGEIVYYLIEPFEKDSI